MITVILNILRKIEALIIRWQNRKVVIAARRDAGLKDVASQNAVFSPGIAILKIKVGQTSKKDARASGKPLADV